MRLRKKEGDRIGRRRIEKRFIKKASENREKRRRGTQKGSINGEKKGNGILMLGRHRHRVFNEGKDANHSPQGK